MTIKIINDHNKHSLIVKTVMNKEFISRQQEAQSYRKAGFSYYQIADLMGISTKQVWMNLKTGEPRDLTVDEMHSAVDRVGIPRGSKRIVMEV